MPVVFITTEDGTRGDRVRVEPAGWRHDNPVSAPGRFCAAAARRRCTRPRASVAQALQM